jgi:predicted aspartyl protease
MRLPVQLGLLCLLAALTACAVAPEPDEDSLTCKLEQVAAMPVRSVGGAILVDGDINRIPVQLQLDTGATTSMLDEDAVARLALPTDPHRRTTLHGIGGSIETQNTMVRSLAIGDQEWQGLSIATGHLAGKFHEGRPVAGLLGADRLSSFDVELDIPDGKLTLWSVSHCAGNFVPWQLPHYVVPLERHSPNRMVAKVEVNAHPVEALVDWGARSTTMTEAVAQGVGVTPDMLASDRSGTNWGIDQTQNIVRLHRFGELKVGGEIFHNIGLPVADLRLREVGMLLGADYARTRRVWLSYASRQMFIVPPKFAKPPAS